MGIKRIAVEEAFVTEEIAQEWKKVLASKFVEPGFQMMGNTILGDDPGARMVHSRLVDTGAGRIQQMDADGIDMAVLSITSPGVQAFDAVTATRLAKDANDALMRLQNQLAVKTPKFSGPTSNADAARYDKAVGDLANPSVSGTEKLRALKDIQELSEKAKNYATQQENYFYQNNKSLRGFNFEDNPFGR